MLVQLPSTASTIVSVVSRIITRAIPSMPTSNITPHDGIHGIVNRACHASLAGSNDHHRPTETTNSSRSVTNAIILGTAARPEATSSVTAGSRVPRPDVTSSASVPRSGNPSNAGITHRS
jgi:hypothetical protein